MGLLRQHKNIVYSLMVILTVVLSVIYYMYDSPIYSSGATSVGENSALNLAIYGNTGAQDFRTDTNPVLLVSLGPEGGVGKDMEVRDGLNTISDYYRNYQPTINTSNSTIAIINDSAVNGIGLSSGKQSRLEFVWYVPGEQTLRTSGTSSSLSKAVVSKFNGGGNTSSDPTSGNGVYRQDLARLRDEGKLADWRSLVNSSTIATSKRVWAWLGTPSGGKFEILNKVNLFRGTAGLNFNNMEIWTEEQTKNASVAHLDLLMTLYSIANDAPSVKQEYEQAIDRYIESGIHPGMVGNTCNIVLGPGCISKLVPEDRYMVSSIYDYWNYAYGITTDNYFSGQEFKEVLQLNGLDGPIFVSERLHANNNNMYQKLYSQDPTKVKGNINYFKGGFATTMEKLFRDVTDVSGEFAGAFPMKSTSGGIVESVTLNFGSGSVAYAGIDVIPAPPSLLNDNLPAGMSFKVTWQGANSQFVEIPEEQDSVNDIVSFRISLKISEHEKTTWETLLAQHNYFALKFDVRSTADTGRVSNNTSQTNAPASLNPIQLQVNGGNYTMGTEVVVSKEELRRYLWGEELFVKMFDRATQNQLIPPGEIEQFGYDMKIDIVYGQGANKNIKEGEWSGWSYDTEDKQGDKHYHSVKAIRTDKNKVRYYSSPEAFAEIKEGSVHRDDTGTTEQWEAMAGVPSTETLYFASGGSEFIVEMELEFVTNERTEREYRYTFFGTECEFKRTDQFRSSDTAGNTDNGFTGTLAENGQTEFTATFVADEMGNDQMTEGFADQWMYMYKAEGSDSYTEKYNGHDASLPAPHSKNRDAYNAAARESGKDMASTTFTATWSGDIKNLTKDPGVGGIVQPSGYPCGGKSGNPGTINAETTKWDMDDYDEKLKQALTWASQYEATNNDPHGTAAKIADSDGEERIWKIGQATISISITGPESNVVKRAWKGGNYTTANANTALSSTTHSQMGNGYSENKGNVASGTCSDSEDGHSHGSWSGFKTTSTSKVGDAAFTIVVTFDNGTMEPHELCGPCCWHELGQIFDCFMQVARYDYTKITGLRVYKIHRSYVDNMEEITLVDYNGSEDRSQSRFLLDWMHGALDDGERSGEINAPTQARRHNGTDTIVAAISQGDPNIFYNIANEQPYYGSSSGSNSAKAYRPSMAGRIRYSYQVNQHDWVYSEEITRRGNIGYLDGYQCTQGSRSNKCDGIALTACNSNPKPSGGQGHGNKWSNGILYTRTFDEVYLYDEQWMGTDKNNDLRITQDEWGTVEKAGAGKVKTAYDNCTMDDKDVLTEEYARWAYRRNEKNTIHIVSDMLILQTSTGDQPVMYYVHPPQTKRLQQHFDYDEADQAKHAAMGIELEGALLKDEFDNEWTNNPNCAYNWGANNIGQSGDVNVGSYTGEYSTPNNKYSSVSNNLKFATVFDNTGGSRIKGDLDAHTPHLLHWTDDYYGNPAGEATNTFRDTQDYGANKYSYCVERYGMAEYVGRTMAYYDAKSSAVQPGAVGPAVVMNVIDEVCQDLYNQEKSAWLAEWVGGAYIPEYDYKSSPCYKIPSQANVLAYTEYSPENRMSRVSGLRIFTDNIVQNPTNPNKEYETGEARQSYIVIKDYDSTNGLFPHQFEMTKVQKRDEDFSGENKLIDGLEIEAPYSRNHDKVNDIIVHDPVSVDSAAVLHSSPSHDNWDRDDYTWEDDFSRDGRVLNELLGATNLTESLNNLDRCPKDASLCDFRVLNCSFNEDQVLAYFDFESEYKDDKGNKKTGSHDNKIVNTINNAQYTLPTGFEVNELVDVRKKLGLSGDAVYWPVKLNGDWIVPSWFGSVRSASLKKQDIIYDSSTSTDLGGGDGTLTQRKMGTYYYPVLTNSGGKQLVPNDNELVEWTNNQKAGERAYHYGRLFGSNGKYLKCFGNQLRIPLSDLVGSYSKDTKLAVEMNFYKPVPRKINVTQNSATYEANAWPAKPTMIAGFRNYGFYIPALTSDQLKKGQTQNKVAAFTEGSGISREVKNTSFIDQAMKIKIVFDFGNPEESELYINGNKVTGFRIVNESDALSSGDIGDALYIGSWGKNASEYPASFYIDNLKITSLATGLLHDETCYEWIENHENTMQYVCQTVDTYNYDDRSNRGYEYVAMPSLFTASRSGRYKLETYGAQGGGTSNQSVSSHAGLGGYSYQYTDLDKGAQLLVYPGGQGQKSTGTESWGGREFSFTGDAQKFTVPSDGRYLLEAWGGSGGADGTGVGGLGGYSKGYANLNAGDEIYVYVGGEGSSAASGDGGGWNGGGHAGASGSSGGGGGMTHMSIGKSSIDGEDDSDSEGDSNIDKSDKTFDVAEIQWMCTDGNMRSVIYEPTSEYINDGGVGNHAKVTLKYSHDYSLVIYDNFTNKHDWFHLQDDTDRICFSCKNYHSSYWSIYTLDKSADKINTLGDPGWGASGASGWNTEHILIVAGGGGGAGNGHDGGAGGGESGSGGVGGTAGGTQTSGFSQGKGESLGPDDTNSSTLDGGGGGGGWYGGTANGTADAGGGGGSGYVGTLTGASSVAGTNSGNGRAKITAIPGYQYPSSGGWNGGGTGGYIGHGGGGASDIRILRYGGEYSIGYNSRPSETRSMSVDKDKIVGPYTAAGVGTYQVDVYGDNIHNASFDAYTNLHPDAPYDMIHARIAENHVTLYFTITDNLSAGNNGLQIRINTGGDNNIKFKKMFISRLEDRIIVAGGGGGADATDGATGIPSTACTCWHCANPKCPSDGKGKGYCGDCGVEKNTPCANNCPFSTTGTEDHTNGSGGHGGGLSGGAAMLNGVVQNTTLVSGSGMGGTQNNGYRLGIGESAYTSNSSSDTTLSDACDCYHCGNPACGNNYCGNHKYDCTGTCPIANSGGTVGNKSYGDAGGGGGGYYGGFSTLDAAGGGGGGSGYISSSNGATSAGVNGGDGSCIISFVRHLNTQGTEARGSQLVKAFDYTGTDQTFTAPVSGIYVFELWGASGGDGRIGNTDTVVARSGGGGGYSTGEMYMRAGQVLHVYVGGKGGDSTSDAHSYGRGGWNGGGDGGAEQSGEVQPENGAGGGGGTDIRMGGKALSDRILVAGGGGGSCGCLVVDDKGGVNVDINPAKSNPNAKFLGGYGGGESGGSTNEFTSAGTKSSGTLGQGDKGYSHSGGSNFGSTGGGGGGYRGGRQVSSVNNSSAYGGAGGSGYIGKGISNAQTLSGQYEFTQPSGKRERGHFGNGYVRILLKGDSNGESHTAECQYIAGPNNVHDHSASCLKDDTGVESTHYNMVLTAALTDAAKGKATTLRNLLGTTLYNTFRTEVTLGTSYNSIESAITWLKNHVRSIPNKVGGEYNPIFQCDWHYNRHSCSLTANKCKEIKVLNCTEPHHTGMHYASAAEATSHGKPYCYVACNNDANHKRRKPEVTSLPGQPAVHQEIYVNTDEYFDIYFPNIGDFYQSNLHGIGSTTPTRGMGYEDGMDTSKWTREKYVRFSFDTLFYREETEEWEQHTAGSWIELPVKGHSYPYYHFYCTLNNSEQSAGSAEFEAEGINADGGSKYNYKNYMYGTVFGKHEFKDMPNSQTHHGAEDFIFKNFGGGYFNNGQSASNHKNNNDNKSSETNRQRMSSLRSLHGGHKTYKLDVVGRIGNLFITDTDDLRFSNLFKLPKADGEWLIDGIVREVYEDVQNYYLSWNYLPGREAEDGEGSLARDVRNRLVLRNRNLYNLWGTQTWNGSAEGPISAAKGHAIEAPVGSDDVLDKNVSQLLGDLMKPGYSVYWEITTTGNYGDMLQVKPYFYALCVKDDKDGGHKKGDLIPVDIHMNTNGVYHTINLFGAVDDTETWEENKNKVLSHDISISWNDEYKRRNYMDEERKMTENISDKFTETLPGGGIKHLEIPHGDYYSIGTVQILRAGREARTFIGTNRTAWELETFNGSDDTNFDRKFESIMYNKQAQRWHLKLGLPSSSVFTFYEKGKHLKPMDEVKYGNTTKPAYQVIADSKCYHIVMTANIKALGSIWNLGYMQNLDGKMKPAETGKQWDNGNLLLITGRDPIPGGTDIDWDKEHDSTVPGVIDGEEVEGTRYYFNYLGDKKEDPGEFRVVFGVFDGGGESSSEVDVDIIGTH